MSFSSVYCWEPCSFTGRATLPPSRLSETVGGIDSSMFYWADESREGVCSDFFVFTVENLPKLRVLEIGEISATPGDKGSSNCFYYASNLEVMSGPPFSS